MLIAALRSGIAPVMSATLDSHPDVIPTVIERLEAWKPDLGEDYRPGWRYKESLDLKAAQKTADETIALLLKPLRKKALLLKNNRYRKLKQELAVAAAKHQKDTFAFNNYRGTDSLNSEEYKNYAISRALRNAAAARVRELEWKIAPSTRWHHRVGWNREDYFDDPGVLQLCEAIERNDLVRMRGLLDEGVRADAVGHDGMTLLLWALPDRRVKRFALLLEHGAEPNVFLESDFDVAGTPLHPYAHGGSLMDDQGCRAGISVTHLVCRSPERGFMEAAFAHGADANLVDRNTGEAPLDLVFSRGLSDHAERAAILLEHGARPNRLCEYNGRHPLTQAVLTKAYKAALLMLKAGANPTLKRKREPPRKGQTALHWVLRHQEHVPFHDPELQDDYDALLAWLEEHRASELEEARDELNEGPLWGAALQADRESQHAERLARKKQAKERLAEKLRQLPVEQAPPTAAERIAALNDEQRAMLGSPLIFEMTMPTRLKNAKPWFRLETSGRLTLWNRLAPQDPEVVTTLDRNEIVWLTHLAINECELLKKDSADYRVHQEPHDDSVFRYRVRSGESRVDLELPTRTLLLKSLRYRLGLFPFKALNAYVDELANHAYLRADDPEGTVLAAINAEAKKQDPTIPSFLPHHLALAMRTDKGHLIATFSREIEVPGGRSFLLVEASYIGSDADPTVHVKVNKRERKR